MELGEALLAVGWGERAASFEVFGDTLDPAWIAEALQATGTATVRRRKLPADLQAAIRKAGAEAGDWERQLESSSDATILAAMEKSGKLKLVKFDERDKLQKSMEPVLAEYAKEIGADAIYARINAIK